MLPQTTKATPTHGLFLARVQLHLLKLVREKPLGCMLVLLLGLSGLPAILLFGCGGDGSLPCPTVRCVQPSSATGVRAVDGLAAAPTGALPLPYDDGDGGAPLSMADVVVGIMTCRRFHRTRCRAQSDTWLRRARRVVFFTDTSEDGTSEELRAPVIAHEFQPSAAERIFSGGNWRAVPILRALAEHFFSEKAQAAIAARHEPLPKWTYMADDDSYAFTPTMLR